MAWKRRSTSIFRKKARRGFRGYPVATVAFYGPDDSRATKVAVGIVAVEGAAVDPLERWFTQDSDIRFDPGVSLAIDDYLRRHDVRSVVITDGVIGCPHEEGVDYPEGETCPQCPFWATRDRWSGEVLH